MGVLSFTARDFRSRQAHLFDLVDSGERVIIRRGNKKAYTLVPVEDDEITITPELQAKIDRARQSVREGKCTVLKSHEDIKAFFNNLWHIEPLKGGDGVIYSRHITAHDRIVYDIEDEKITVTVLEVEGHYNDK